jgi:hypothetical protein
MFVTTLLDSRKTAQHARHPCVGRMGARCSSPRSANLGLLPSHAPASGRGDRAWCAQYRTWAPADGECNCKQSRPKKWGSEEPLGCPEAGSTHTTALDQPPGCKPAATPVGATTDMHHVNARQRSRRACRLCRCTASARRSSRRPFRRKKSCPSRLCTPWSWPAPAGTWRVQPIRP